MTARRSLAALGRALAIPLGVAAALGLVDALRSLPGPGIALALPLRETGHDDRASLAVVVAAFALVFGLAALALDPPRRRRKLAAPLRALIVLGSALALQAVSLQLVRQATLGFDWAGALGSPAPFVCAFGALCGIVAVELAPSSDRGRGAGHEEHPVEGPSPVPPLARIGT
jgi:hypothetical protein